MSVLCLTLSLDSNQITGGLDQKNVLARKKTDLMSPQKEQMARLVRGGTIATASGTEQMKDLGKD